MTYGNSGIGDNYGFDGMSCNIDTLESQEQEEARERAWKEEAVKNEIARQVLRLKLYKKFSRYNSNNEILSHAIRYLINQQTNNIIKNYLIKEKTPLYYKEIVNQKNAIQILVSQFFINVIGIKLDSFKYDELEELVRMVEKNIDKESAYVRTGEIRNFIYETVSTLLKIDSLETPENTIEIRNLLSACRLALLLNDFFCHDIDYQNDVNDKTKLDFFYEMSKPIEASTLPSGKMYVSRWKARHLHTLDYYTNAKIGDCIKKMESIDTNSELAQYVTAIVDACVYHS
ncbi:hypothetical protein [Vibrio sp. Vb339]|uniref:hypothetical protein n=1 Tax=Vibrio sp. Vb339 TaxID=1192013 RepID=UPI0015578B5E|nr:hypothetical protein [Vibrio sp. Vb339]